MENVHGLNPLKYLIGNACHLFYWAKIKTVKTCSQSNHVKGLLHEWLILICLTNQTNLMLHCLLICHTLTLFPSCFSFLINCKKHFTPKATKINESDSIFEKLMFLTFHFRWHFMIHSVFLHSTPKESIHFEFRSVSTQNLHHVGPMRGYGG